MWLALTPGSGEGGGLSLQCLPGSGPHTGSRRVGWQEGLPTRLQLLWCPAVPFLPTQRLWNAPGELGRTPGAGPGLARIAVCRPRRRAPACFQDVLFTSLCSGSVSKACLAGRDFQRSGHVP